MRDAYAHLFTEANVIPLQALGVIDVGATDIGDNEMLANALANTSTVQLEKGYVIKRSSEFINEYGRRDEGGQRVEGSVEDPNHMMGTFVVLWPYVMGGIETRRPVEVPYNVHIQALLQQSDKSFRLHHHFVFQAFGILRKRQVCSAACLQIKKADFIRNQEAI
jgi:hypothetical protein